ncbi:MAG TPA: phosphotransferase family protein [Streptosporangiaceae bacterium]|nr:phosphotransferase family protein [Streptosporangiaceae bacterium]
MGPLVAGPVDMAAVERWMDSAGLGTGPLADVEPIAGGTQNVLVRFSRGGRGFVLRRPPLHKRQNSDETMRREARVLAGLSDSGVPHPRLIAACDDLDVIGAVFYLMEPVAGFTPTVTRPAFLDDSASQREMALAVVDALAALGRVDVAAAGLATLGRAEGWLERQVGRWTSQLESYAKFPDWSAAGLPDTEALCGWLSANRPPSWSAGLIHGDYHLANVMIRQDGPQVAAVVDWELATVGDPLVDLGQLLATWCEDGGVASASTVLALPGFPSRAELVARYAAGSARDLSSVGWYHALACYRLGVLLEGTHARSTAGQADRGSGQRMRQMAAALFEQGLAIAAGR